MNIDTLFKLVITSFQALYPHNIDSMMEILKLKETYEEYLNNKAN